MENMENQPGTILLEVPLDSDLPLRLEKISEQTGLSFFNLLQKWVLQEEALIGIVLCGKDPARQRIEAHPSVSKRAEVPLPEPSDPNYRKILIRRALKLKKRGMTLKNMAEKFNNEKVPTVSGTGKWYSSSISNLLNSGK